MPNPNEGNPAAPTDDVTPNPPATPSGDATPNLPLEPEVPKELWYIGVGLSALLVLVGLYGMKSDPRLYSVGTLAVCVGFGILIAVFGGRSTGRFLQFAVVGSGATAISLYLLLYNYSIDGETTYYVGDIYNTGEFSAIRGYGARVFLTGQLGPRGDFRFAIAEDEIGDGIVRFKFDLPGGFKLSNGDDLREFEITCINAQDLKTIISQSGSLTLEEGDVGQFGLVETGTQRQLGHIAPHDCNAPPADPTTVAAVDLLSWFVSPVYAQDVAALDIPEAVSLLESDDGYLRDLARQQLASLRDAEAYKAVVGSWNIVESSYRADLGRLVAWSSAIQQDRSSAVTLAEALTSDQLRYVVQLTGQGDITMRQYATEVLHRLLETTSWPNGPSAERAQMIVAATLAVFSSSGFEELSKPSMEFNEDNLRYNSIVAIGFTECNIGEGYRPLVVEALSDLALRLNASGGFPRTIAKLAKVLDALKTCP